VTWAPRGSLHKDTVFGMIRWYEKIKINKRLDEETASRIVGEAVPFCRIGKTCSIQR